MAKVLVTGGAGFIGSHVADLLIGQGHTVEVMDDFSSGKRDQVAPGATLHEMDIRSAEAARVVEQGKFDAIVHLAAQMDVRKSVADPMFDASVNILGTLNLVEAVRRSGHRTRIAFASSGGAAYGDFAAPPTDETDSKNPESPYGVAKLSVEYYLGYYNRVHGMDNVALRFSNVYGPRQDPHGEAGVVAIFCGRILDGRPLTVFGTGEQTRDYVYVGDVAAAVARAALGELPAARELDTRAYNVGTGVQTSVLTLAHVLLEAAERDVPVEHAAHRPGEQQRSAVSVDKAKAELGWAPRVSLLDGLARTYAWFAARAAENTTSAR